MTQFLAEEHENPRHSQVLIALTGTPATIKRELEQILRNIDEYGKPMQGITHSYNMTREVITPVWDERTC